MSRLALCNIIGPLTDLQQKLAGDNGPEWLEALNKMLRKENPWEDMLVAPQLQTVQVQLDWRRAYEVLGMVAEYDAQILALPMAHPEGIWTVPVLKIKDEKNRLTCNKVVAALRKLDVQVYLYADDLDKAVTVNDRDPAKGSYAVSFRACVEADEDNKNQSANQRKEQGCKDITLLERLLLELAYFMATKQHLDIDNVTLCTGSRYSDGDVPRVCWRSDNRRVCVGWSDPGRCDDGLRTRSVVSLPAKASEAQPKQA